MDERNLSRMATRKRRSMRRRRRIRQLTATVGGYFWLPCPLCGEDFGGNEWIGRIKLPGEDGFSSGICPACELDLGAKAIALCEREGHHRLETFAVAQSLIEDGDRIEVFASVDFTAPTGAYCETCGIDLGDRDG